MRKTIHQDAVDQTSGVKVNPRALFVSTLDLVDGHIQFSDAIGMTFLTDTDEPSGIRKTLVNLRQPRAFFAAPERLDADDLKLRAIVRDGKLLHINTRCYFVFMLSEKINNWYFDLVDLAISTKPDPNSPDDTDSYKSRISQVLYFDQYLNPIPMDPADYRFGNTGNIRTDCAIIAFGIREMAKEESFGVNLHVAISTSIGEVVPTIFDPDIKNDGGGFTPTQP